MGKTKLWFWETSQTYGDVVMTVNVLGVGCKELRWGNSQRRAPHPCWGPETSQKLCPP
jgi:hypothetical protein